MSNDTTRTSVAKQYAEAHSAHYRMKDLPVALKLYRELMAAHPDTEEAKYSRAQIRNIVNDVVPKQELLDAQVELVSTHLENKRPGADGVESNELQQQRDAVDDAWNRSVSERREVEITRRKNKRMRGAH